MEKRQSRQNIVVPPKGVSATSMIIGAVLCGLAGFAVVWLAGLGRKVTVTQSPIPTASANTMVPAHMERSLHAVRSEPGPEPQQSRFSSNGQEPYFKPMRGGDYPTQPASFERPIEDNVSATKVTEEKPAKAEEKPLKAEKNSLKDGASDSEPGHLSRFSAKQILPLEQEAAEEQPAALKQSEKWDIKNETPLTESDTKPEHTPTSNGSAQEVNEEDASNVLQKEHSEATRLVTKQINDDLAETTSNAETTSKSVSSPSLLVMENEADVGLPMKPSGPDTSSKEVLAAKELPIPDQPESLASEVLAPTIVASETGKTAVKSEVGAASEEVAAIKKADETAEPVSETARSKTPESEGESLTNAEPARMAPLASEQKAPMPVLNGEKDASLPQPLASTNTETPLSAQSNPFASPAETKEASANNRNQPLQSTGGTMPFAAAPPLGKPLQNSLNNLEPPKKAEPLSEKTPSQPGTSGQGRPGLPQTEGLQTPQLTLEKSGPRDLQVGKPARFEVVIRNVGAATAHDTVLRDAVPYGTSLITTMPPASPADTNAPSGELLWAIGELKPGQEARVAMEVMPQLEGDVGSVASVTFRADATVRSRVTKPALEITAETPQPTLIGEMMAVDILLSNPGTGTATGVIVEGILPDSVSHPAGREVEFDVGQLEPGSSRSISLKLATITPGVHEIRIGARADGGIEVSRPLRAEITAPMLELHADIPKRRYLQRPATCTLNMHNTGTAPALAVELAAQLPPGMKFVRANNAGYYDENTHRVLWSLEELPAGELGTVEFVAMPTVLGPQTIVAAVRNPAGLADQLSHSIEVEGLASLALEVADSEDPIEINGLTEYVVRVENQGTKAAENVALSAKLLGDLQPVEARGPVPYEVQNLMITFEPLASLAPADEAVFHVQVRGRRPGNQRVQFQLQSDDLQAPLTSEEMTHVYADR